MTGSSQGNAYPGYGSTYPISVSRKQRLNCGNTKSSCACRGHGNGAEHVCQGRPRILFSDAALVRARVESRASQLCLRGARRHVLTAVLALLCGWNRISDDRVALGQIVDLVVAGGGRAYDLKTVGRALASLAADQLIAYRPASGRGTRATVAIHDEFVGDVAVLKRDAAGRVVVGAHGGSPRARGQVGGGPAAGQVAANRDSITFSGPFPYRYQGDNPPTPQNDPQPLATRPNGVEVSSDDLRHVLRNLPHPLDELPRHLRWSLGRETRGRLAAGWRADQILAVLCAPMPPDVRRPWRLALWRLRRNMPGAGPRLRRLQRAWDLAADAQAQEAADELVAGWHRKVTAATSRDDRATLLIAHERQYGCRTTDPVQALAAAGRRVTRRSPGVPLGKALMQWAAQVLGPQSDHIVSEPVSPKTGGGGARTLTADMLIEMAIGDGECTVCASSEGVAREELPLRSLVCEQCWPVIAAQLLDDPLDEQVVA